MFPFFANPNETKVGIINALQNATYLNGKICLMKKFHESRNRWQVVVNNEDQQESIFLVKEENLKKVAIHELLVFQFLKQDFDVLDITSLILDNVEKDKNGTLEAEMQQINLKSENTAFEEYTLRAMLEFIYIALVHESENLDSSEKKMLMVVDISKLDVSNEHVAEFLFEDLQVGGLRLNICELMYRPVLTYVLNFHKERSYVWKKSETDFKQVNRWIYQRFNNKNGCCICDEDIESAKDGFGRTCKQCFALICESCEKEMVKRHGFIFPCPLCRGDVNCF